MHFALCAFLEVLYRKYRPQTLSEIIGQPHIVSYFEKAFKSGNIGHAYLFSGPRGLGKTSVARIIAKTINCLKDNKPCLWCSSCQAVLAGNHLDILEIDAASNRGIDDIRALRETVGLLPQMGNFKVYILDEAHMLTTDAANALLKTLEEPPAHVIFILCTTESYKLPETILSRVLRFDFNVPEVKLLTEYLKDIAGKEKINLQDSVFGLLAQKSGGSFRDALGLLDKVIGSHETGADEAITTEQAEEILGLVSFEKVQEFLGLLVQKDPFGAIDFINSWVTDFSEFVKELLLILRQEVLKAARPHFSENKTLQLIKLLLNAQRESKFTDIPQLPLEMAVLEFCQDDLSDRINSSNPAATTIKDNSLTSLSAFWPKLLEDIKQFNHSIELSLRACQPKKLENGILELSFEFPFHQEQINKEQNRRLIEEVASKIVGLPVRVKAILNSNKRLVNFQDRVGEGPENSAVAPNSAVDPLIQAVKDLGGVLMQ